MSLRSKNLGNYIGLVAMCQEGVSDTDQVHISYSVTLVICRERQLVHTLRIAVLE